MKKIIALLLALAMMLTGTAFAASTAENTWKLTLTITAADGTPIAAFVHLKNADDTYEFSDYAAADGTITLDLEENIYTIRVTDKSDNYSTQETIGLYEDTDMAMIIRKLVPGSEVTVGTLSKPTGKFAVAGFGNNTSDIDVRAMLNGYSTVAFTQDASYAVDESVAVLETANKDDLGNKVYTFSVVDGLTYSDGTPITAKDYVFSILMQSSPAFAEVGGSNNAYSSLLGYKEYANGSRDYFSGVRLIDDYTFSMTILTDYLPYYYELTYVNVTPYPISVLAPGAKVADDGRGAYITGGLTADLLQSTLIDSYLSNPAVVSGPYTLESWDAETGTVVMKANTNYKGTYEGARPLIETVTLTATTNDEAISQIADGTLDIVNKVSNADVISAGTEAVNNDTLQSSNYLRSGLGFLGFACEEGPTSSQYVRQAVSYLFDQNTFVTDYTGTNGMAVYSWYGLGQWMAADYINEMDQHVTVYDFDTAKAAKMLEKAGYTYNSEGKTWKEGDGVRYRLLKGNELKNYNAADTHIVEAIQSGNMNLLPLKLVFAKVENNKMNDLLVEELFPNLEAAGFEIETKEMSYTEMLRQYYREDERTCNAFALATNFDFVYDPYYSFLGDEKYQGTVNTTGINDADLAAAAKKLRSTTPGDEATYEQRWLTLMKKYSDVLPTVPLYSNVYYDFFNTSVQGYEPNSVWSWTSAILYTYIEEPAATATNIN